MAESNGAAAGEENGDAEHSALKDILEDLDKHSVESLYSQLRLKVKPKSKADIITRILEVPEGGIEHAPSVIRSNARSKKIKCTGLIGRIIQELLQHGHRECVYRVLPHTRLEWYSHVLNVINDVPETQPIPVPPLIPAPVAPVIITPPVLVEEGTQTMQIHDELFKSFELLTKIDVSLTVVDKIIKSDRASLNIDGYKTIAEDLKSCKADIEILIRAGNPTMQIAVSERKKRYEETVSIVSEMQLANIHTLITDLEKCNSKNSY